MSARTLEDGQSTQVKGSSSTYTLSRRGAVYACTCPAWRNQGAVLDRRTCKHLRAYLGDAEETARVGAPASTPVAKRAPLAGAAGAVEGEAAEAAPPILLAHKWETEHDPTGWWMSEKLDGVRAYWDGEGFVSRLGNRFSAPDWFIADLPADTLDGELWVGRKMFSRTISIVRSGAGDKEWKHVRYVVFDAPNARGGFEDRLSHVERVLERSGAPHAAVHEHQRCEGIDHLQDELRRVEALGGEGLMLRQPGSRYEVGRSTSLLKVKTFHDAEGRVIGHVPGAGKHKGRLGAVVCELPSGATFNIGTGFSDAERKAPPPIGSVVTFRYQELTDDGIPRFPTWVGVRIDAEWPPRSQARPVSAVASKRTAPSVNAVARAEPAPAASKGAAKAQRGEAPKETASAASQGAASKGAAKTSHNATSADVPDSELIAELVHTKEHKFWKIEVRGASHVTHFGKVGSAGQQRIVEHDSAAAARADAEKRAGQKRKEGYSDRR